MRIDSLPFEANYFWSYKKDADLPVGIIAEKVLIYGDFEDIYWLQGEIGAETMVKVWNQRIRENPRYSRLNAVLEVMYGDNELNAKYAPPNLESFQEAGNM